MPIYEYRCIACGQTSEFLQKVSDKPKKDCPECGKLELVKIISNTSFQLKGTGWYVTDFRDNDKKKSGETKKNTPKEQKKDSSGAQTSQDNKDKK